MEANPIRVTRVSDTGTLVTKSDMLPKAIWSKIRSLLVSILGGFTKTTYQQVSRLAVAWPKRFPTQLNAQLREGKVWIKHYF